MERLRLYRVSGALVIPLKTMLVLAKNKNDAGRILKEQDVEVILNSDERWRDYQYYDIIPATELKIDKIVLNEKKKYKEFDMENAFKDDNI